MSLNVIRTAIRERRLLVFQYRGFRRVVAPLAVGISRKGSWQLRGQQVGGDSATRRVGDGTPKLFDVALVRHAAVTTTTFGLPPGYERDDEAFAIIDTALGDTALADTALADTALGDAAAAPSADAAAGSADHP